MENWLIFCGIWGEAELILRIWGAMEKYFQGPEEFSFSDLGSSMNFFRDQGSTKFCQVKLFHKISIILRV